MDDLLKNKLFWVVVLFTMFNLGFFVVNKVLVDKTADRVIERLQKEYSPSPYGPGFDPDRVDPEVLRNQRVYYELTQSTVGEDIIPLYDSARTVSIWRDDWEYDRGVNR